MSKAHAINALLAGLAVLLPGSVYPEPDRVDPVRVSAAEQARLFAPAVREGAAALAELTRADAGADAITAELKSVTDHPGLSPAERDAVLYDYVRRLRSDAPGTAPEAVLEWLQAYRPQAVRRHDESANYWIALFNVRAAAIGLENQWTYETARSDLLDGGLEQVTSMLTRYVADPGGPYAGGLRSALFEAQPGMLAALAERSAADPGLTDSLLPYLMLARGGIDQLAARIVDTPPQIAADVLSRAARELRPGDAATLLKAAMQHPDPGVGAMAMARITDSMLDDPERQAEWGKQMLDLLTDEKLGSSAALQLSRIGAADWLEKAAGRMRSDDPVLLQRLELMAELEKFGNARTGPSERPR